MEAPAPGLDPGRAVERSDTSKSTARDVGNPAHTFGEQLERIAANDRRWFERHPKRRWRIRPPLPGKYPWLRSAPMGNTQVLLFDDAEREHPKVPAKTVRVWNLIVAERQNGGSS